ATSAGFRSVCSRRGALQQQGPFAIVLRERSGAFVLGPCFVAVAETRKEVGAYRRHEVVARERRHIRELVEDLEARRGPVRERDRDRTIQLDDRRWRRRRELVVDRDDAPPIGVLGRSRACMTRGDPGLQEIRTRGATERLAALQGHQTALDEKAI